MKLLYLLLSFISAQTLDEPIGIDDFPFGVYTKQLCNNYLDCFNCTLSNCQWNTKTMRCVENQVITNTSTLTQSNISDAFVQGDFGNFDPNKKKESLNETTVKTFFERGAVCGDPMELCRR